MAYKNVQAAIIFSSMGDKYACSKIVPWVMAKIEGLFQFTHTTTSILDAYFENGCHLSFVKSGFHCRNDIFKEKGSLKKFQEIMHQTAQNIFQNTSYELDKQSLVRQ